MTEVTANLISHTSLKQSAKSNNHIKQKSSAIKLNFLFVVDRGIEPLCQD